MRKHLGMAKVRCICGDEILLLPDLKEMGKAIDDHVDMHIKNLKAPRCSAVKAENLRLDLIAQVFRLISQVEEEENP